MSKKLILGLLLLTFLANSLQTNGRDTGIDPGRITWWKNSWTARPIEVSRSNAGSSGVSLTFKFQTTQDLKAGGFVEVYFPSGMTAPGSELNNKRTVQTQAQITANDDTSVTVTGVTLPSSSGAYGPFRLITRQYQEGEIYDISNSFASIYVTPSAGADGTLTVTSHDGEPVKVLSATKLDFQMTVPLDFWMHDTIVVTLDSKWSIDSTEIGCESRDLEGDDVNYFQQGGSNTLRCSVSGNKFYIYSVSEDKDVSLLGGSVVLALRLSGIVGPSANWGATNYSHSVEIYRWGTMNLLKNYSGTGPQTAVGEITDVSWETHNGYPKSDIVQGLTLYTNISFKLSNPVPQNGKIVVSFNSVEVFATKYMLDVNAANGTGDYCFVEWINRDIVCDTLNTQKVEIKVNSGMLMENDKITLTVLSYFNNAQPQIGIKSYWSDGSTQIDSTESNEVITYADQGVESASYYRLTFATDAGPYTNHFSTGTADKYMILAVMQLKSGLFVTNDRLDLTINMPINNVGLQDRSVYISADASAVKGPFRLNYSLSTSNSELDLFDNTSDSYAEAVRSTNSISTNSAIDISSKNGGTFGFYNNNCTGTEQECNDYSTNFSTAYMTNMFLPRVASNAATRYESWAVGIVNDIKYVRFQVLTFEASEFTGTLFTRYCGQLMKFDLNVPFTVDASNTSRTYYLDIDFSTSHPADLGSNLPLESSYPVYQTAFDSSATFTLMSRKLRIANQSQYQHDDTTDILYDLYFASNDSTGNKITAKLYYLENDKNPSIEYVILYEELNDTDVNPAADTIDLSANLDQPVFTTNQSITTAGMGSAAALTGEITTIQLPLGYTLENFSLTAASGTQTLANTQALLSSDPYYAFPLVFTTQTCAVGACNLTLTGINLPKFSSQQVGGSVADTPFVIGSVDNVAHCKIASTTYDVLSQKRTIELQSASPSTVQARSPSSYHTNLSVSFKLQYGLAKNSKIIVVIDPNWEPTQNYCQVDGLTDESDDTQVQCFNNGSGNTFTITGFGAVPAQTTATLTWPNSLPPESTGTATIQVKYLTSIEIQSFVPANISTGYQTNSWYYVYQQGTISNTASVSQASNVGQSTLQQVKTIPPNASEVDVDIYLRFQLTNPIPAGSTIEITSATNEWKVPQTNTKDYVFCSKQFTSVTLNNPKLIFVMAEAVSANADGIEFFIKRGIDNPSSNTTVGFLLKTSYLDIVFDQDTQINASTTHNLTVQPIISGTITMDTNGIVLSNTTANEYADYTFTFRTSLNVDATDSIWIKFPRDYEPYLGLSEIKYKWASPSYYYIDCSSSRLGENVECTVDQWMLRVYNLNNVQFNTDISITVYGVKNPKYQSTSSTGVFQIFTVNQQGSAQSKNRAIDGLIFDNQADNISMKLQSITNTSTFESGNYRFEFFTDAAFSPTTKLQIKLPRQYNTNLERNLEQISCQFSYVNMSDDQTTLNEVSVSEISACDTANNVISMEFPTFAETLTNMHKIIFKTTDMANPTWGFTRNQVSNPASNFDASDSNVFTLYDVWTEQFQAMLVQGTQTVAKSYLDVNASYLGFQQPFRGFIVNQYNPISQANQIKLNPGTQSDEVQIKTLAGENEPLAAFKVKFIPETNKFTDDGDNLKFTSDDDFEMYLYQDTINFKVAAAIDISPGIYFINWKIEEDPLVPNTPLYHAPVKTMIEIKYKNSISFQVGTISPIAVGYKSAPIKVSTLNAPHNSLNIALSLGTPTTGVSVQPTELNFSSDVNERYFQITITNEFVVGTGSTSQTLNFVSTGADKDAYLQIGAISFSILSSSTPQTPTISQLTHDDPTRTSVNISATADANGIFYWFVAPYGTDLPQAQALKDDVGDYFEIIRDNTEQEEEEEELTPNDKDKEQTRLDHWVAYQRRLYKQFLKQTMIGAAVSIDGASVKIAELEGLFAQTDYIVYCIVADGLDQNSAAVTNIFSTDEMADAAAFSIEFNDIVNASSLNGLQNLSATVIGIPPLRMLKPTRIVDEVQRVTKFTWTIPPVRHVQSPDPIQYVQLDNEQPAMLLKGILDLGIQASPTVTFALIGRESFEVPEWNLELNGVPAVKQNYPTDISVVVTSMCKTVGEICGVCLTSSPDNNINENQILLGLNEDNQDAQGLCLNYTDITKSLDLEITGLTPDTSYTCYFMCYNDYPLWPTHIPYDFSESGQEIKSLQFVTQKEAESSDDFASVLTVAIALLLVV